MIYDFRFTIYDLRDLNRKSYIVNRNSFFYFENNIIFTNLVYSFYRIIQTGYNKIN
jgi:hypothetical protein